ncbi:MAG: Flp family type IVb pilin [Clostridiaceae bacterium]|nr:Flp family type IVb pilin [Clostridiaceae bacterium]
MITRLYNYWYNIKETLKDKKGQGMVEYALIIGLIAVVLITVLTNMGGGIKSKFQDIVNALTTTTP